jgi:hypothetical protein
MKDGTLYVDLGSHQREHCSYPLQAPGYEWGLLGAAVLLVRGASLRGTPTLSSCVSLDIRIRIASLLLFIWIATKIICSYPFRRWDKRRGYRGQQYCWSGVQVSVKRLASVPVYH